MNSRRKISKQAFRKVYEHLVWSKKQYLVIFIFTTFVFQACQNTEKPHTKRVVVNFSLNDSIARQHDNFNDTTRSLSVAVSAIISPRETFVYYKELFNFISKKINHPIEVKQRQTYGEVNQMLIHNEVEMAFICSGAYTKIENNVDIIAVPVCNGKPFYQAFIITSKNSGITKFEDFRGKSFAFTDPLSNTGKLYADKRLTDLNTNSDVFFSSTLFTHAHDISIQLVSKMVVDGATVDALIYHYLSTFYPERIKNITIVEKSEYYGIPPIVVPSSLSPELKTELKNILLTLHEDSAGVVVLNKLLIDKFIEGNDDDYNSIRAMQNLTNQ